MFLKEQGLSCSPWNNHVPKGARVPFLKGHDYSLGKKRFKLLFPKDMIVP
jgi:hypothetical protein